MKHFNNIRGRSIGVVSNLLANRRTQAKIIFFSYETPGPTREPKKSLIQKVPGSLFAEINAVVTCRWPFVSIQCQINEWNCNLYSAAYVDIFGPRM
jgi:hypothetical protein